MSSDTENLDHVSPASDGSDQQKDTSPADMLRMQQQMSNQCFEMSVQLNAGKIKRCCSTSEAERDLPDYMNEVEKVRTTYFNSALALHRMQIWHAIEEKLSEGESDSLRVMNNRCMALCSRIKQLQQESKTLQDEITQLKEQRLEIKRLTHEKMKQTKELVSEKEHPDSQKYKAALEKGQANLEKYKKMAVMTQNVLRGILLACKINWMDPDVRDIAMTLEEFPITE